MTTLIISASKEDIEKWTNSRWTTKVADSALTARDQLADVDLLICAKNKLLKLIESDVELPLVWCDISLEPNALDAKLHITDYNVNWVPNSEDYFPMGYPDQWPENSWAIFKDLAITGLWKREVLVRWAELEQKKRLDGHYHLAFFDANGLKTANDNFGHEAGDNLLRGIADAILSAMEKNQHGIVTRWTGGDEFIAIWEDGLSDKEFRAVFDQQCRAKQVTASIGVVELGTDDLDDFDGKMKSKIQQADALMQQDKKRRKAGRDYIGRPSFRQRLLGVAPSAPGPIERTDVNSPILWVWSQDDELQKSVEDVALSLSWALAENDVPVVLASSGNDNWPKRLRVPTAMFDETPHGRIWSHPDKLWFAMLTDTISSALYNAEDPKIIVALGSDTPPPSDVVDVNIVVDRVTAKKIMVTFAGKHEIPNTNYPATLAGRPDDLWLDWAKNAIRPMITGLHRFL